jgi:hypothetical protein
MPYLKTEEQINKQIKRLILNRIEKNKTEKYPVSMDVLAHTFWLDFPCYRDETLDKIADKARLTKLFETINSQNQNLF